MPMRIGCAVLSSLRRVNGSRYDTTDSSAAVCSFKIEKPLQAGLKPGLYNGKNNGRSNGLRDREPNARVARTAWDMRRQCDAPIRRGNGEIRDTTFWQGGADYRRRYWDRASDRAGVCAGRRERGRGRTTVGKASRGDQRSPEARWRGIGDG